MGHVLGRLQAFLKRLAAARTKEEVGLQGPAALMAGNQGRGRLLVRVMIDFLRQVLAAKRAKEGIGLDLPAARGADRRAWLQMLRQGLIFFLTLTAMGTESGPVLHFLGTMDTIKFRLRRRQGGIQDLLVLLGEISAGLPELGHPFADFFGDLRQSFRPEEDQGQNQKQNDLFERNADQEPP